MKIDIHTHTKECKSGDAPTREITPVAFCEKVMATEVRIIAITNHNVFDFQQFKDIEGLLGGDAQVWPGIELDIMEDEGRGHLIVIVSPAIADRFSEVVKQITSKSSPDNFATTIEQVHQSFDEMHPLYVAHYRQKKPNISDEAIKQLESRTQNPGRVIKEVTNSISAGIYISHGHASIYGSDIHDWEKYEELSHSLPDLRLSVDSFEHFCLLLEKDPTTINTAMDKKTSEEITLTPFEDATPLKIKVYNDINVIFGSKGTGKSCILEAIAKHYSENGIDARVYVSASDRLDDIFDIKGKLLTINLNNYSIEYCTDEIDSLRNAGEVDVTSIYKYVDYFSIRSTNNNAKKLLLKDIEPEEESTPRREFSEINDAVNTTTEFLEFINDSPSVKVAISDEDFFELSRLLSALLERLSDRKWIKFSNWKEICLLNTAIDLFRKEIAKKTGSPAKPTTTGFREYAMNRIGIDVNATKVIKSINATIPTLTEQIGSLGSNKGHLEFLTEFIFQNGTIADGSLKSLSDVKKIPQKAFVSQINKILANVYTEELFQCIAGLNDIPEVEGIKSIYELIQFKRYFALNGHPYSPSSGEASICTFWKTRRQSRF